ncbi:MAG: cation diffusion facilitator family transporter [Kiritimatiellae bacterium]|nr:cation diffusion facilitator family transporter [Kiritimatiellia bacterium]
MNDETIQSHLAAGKRVATAATLLTVLLAIGKGAIGRLRGSPALTADAVHSFADSLAIFASWIGLKLAERAPTKRFPFGLYRAETLAALLVSALLLLAGGHLLLESARGLVEPSGALHHSVEVLVAALFSAALSFGIYVWEKRAGTRLGSQSLLANADESRVDILTSMAVFAGAGASYIGVGHVEMVVTAALSLLIIWLGARHGRVALFALLDASLDPDLERQVRQVAGQTPGVMRVTEVQLRQAGLFWFGIARIQLRRSVDITRGHDIAHRVVQAVRGAIPRIESLTVHLEPFAPEQLTVLVPVAGNTLESRVSPHFGRAPFFALATLAGARVTRLAFIENSARQKQARAGLAAIKQVFEKNSADAVIALEIGEIAFHALRDYYVEVYSTANATLKDALTGFAQGALPVLSGPTHASEAAAAPAAPDPP